MLRQMKMLGNGESRAFISYAKFMIVNSKSKFGACFYYICSVGALCAEK